MPTESKFIVNVNSRKGGVGKTTLGLAIALDLLDDKSGGKDIRGVLLSADIFGSEIVDALVPYKGDEPKCWSLALLDVLVQSTGGNVSLRALVKERLQKVKEGDNGLPILRPFGSEKAGLLVIPSVRWRDASDRRRHLDLSNGSARRHDLTLVAESMGFLQLEIRLTALVDAILEVFAPQVLVIDHAPFHFPLSKIPLRWTSDDKLASLLFDKEATQHWKPYKLRHLEVAGPDHQDLFAFLAELLDTTQREAMHQEGKKRWVLNRDVHLTSTPGFAACNTGRLLKNKVQSWKELGHVLFTPELMAGIHGRNISIIRNDEGGILHQYNMVMRDSEVNHIRMLTDLCENNRLNPRVFDGDVNNGRFKSKDWKDFLE